MPQTGTEHRSQNKPAEVPTEDIFTEQQVPLTTSKFNHLWLKKQQRQIRVPQVVYAEDASCPEELPFSGVYLQGNGRVSPLAFTTVQPARLQLFIPLAL